MTEREGVASVRIEAAGRSTEVAPIVLALYDAHHRELASFIRGIERDPRVAEDVLSETFVRLIEEIRRGRMPEQPRAWLYRVAANLVVDGGRHRTVVGRVIGRLVDHRTEPPPDEEILRGETRREVWAALGTLPTDARTALLLAAHGFSGREVAQALGRTELATRSLICRARLRLREQLGRTRGDAMIDHAAARTAFATSLDFALEPDEREKLEAHLRDCAACRSFVASMRNDSAVLGETSTSGRCPMAVRANVAIAAERGSARRSRRAGHPVGRVPGRCCSLPLGAASWASAVGVRARSRPAPAARRPGTQVSWTTDVVALTARDFSIVAGGKTFRAVVPNVSVQLRSGRRHVPDARGDLAGERRRDAPQPLLRRRRDRLVGRRGPDLQRRRERLSGCMPRDRCSGRRSGRPGPATRTSP